MAQVQMNRSQGYPSQSFGYPTAPVGYDARQPSYAASVNSYGAPAGYPGVPQTPGRGSINPYASGQFTRASTTGPGRSNSRSNLARQSKSLGASKASLADEKGGKTNIRQEYHDKKLRTNFQSPNYGRGRTPFRISIALFVVGGIIIMVGVTLLLLRFHNNIMLSVDKGEIIGPILIAIGVGAIAGGVKFCYDAYKISNSERQKIKFTAADQSLISARTMDSARKFKQAPGEVLVSGTVTANAVSRTPHGSMGSLNDI
ncbi:hypothetical protein BOX15_Mlig015535g3 [Macrostomum lignano]|uniref:Uncharacterized protein n=1 Tax=Macrostomum lignano TaxID=282301 RepID=A0A267G8F9_9PLAT|nr:hypothetical protein BOX15_Mlig015535g3 [Macrostomum lignano]